MLTVETTKNLLTGGLAATAAGCAAVALARLARRRSLLPLDRHSRRVTWGVPEIILAFIVMVGIQTGMFAMLQYGGVFRQLYGADPVPGNELLTHRCSLWVSVLSTPLVLAAVLVILWAARRAPPQLLGIWAWRWSANVALGFFVWLTLTPLVFGIHYGAHYLHENVLGFERRLHPLEQVFRGDATPTEWILLVAQAVVFAPLLEELLFRGLLLPWLAKGPLRSAAAGLVALALALVRYDPVHPVESLIPAAFVLIVGAIGALATGCERGPEWRWRAILGSSILFAMLHADAWPAPVPLLFLALGLGWLTQRTRSLIGPIVLHALFNAVSTLMLLRGIDL